MYSYDEHMPEEDYKYDDLDDIEFEVDESTESRVNTPRMNTSLRAQARRDRNAVIGQKGTTQSNSANSLDTLNSVRRERSPSPYGRRTPRVTETPTIEDVIVDITPAEHVDPKEKLEKGLRDALEEYSRQRLRAVHMSLRRYGNVDARISQKDLQQAFQENEVSLSNRMLQMIFDIFEDHVGVDYEQMYKCLTAAHAKTNRDSVKARRLRNDLAAHGEVSLEKQDAEFLRRVEEMLIRDKVFFDIDALRKDFRSWDATRTGTIAKDSMLMICSERTPLYGALLKNLAKRCDVEKNDQVSWPEFLNFLDKAQQRAWLKVPELSKLPEKAKQEPKFSVNPNPIEELSTNARSRVVSKLLRRREKSTLSNSDKISPNREKSGLEKETSNVSAKNTENTQKLAVPGDGSMKTSKNKLVEPEQVPIIEVENPSEASGDNEVKVKSDQPEVEASPATNDGSSDPPAQPVAETGTGKEKKKTPEANKFGSDNKRKDKDTSKETKNVPSEKSSKNNDKKEDSKETKTTTPTEKKHNKINSKEKEKKAEVESDPEPELTSPNDVIVNIHEKKVRVYRPSAYKDDHLPIDPPTERLQLDWIYGYRGHDCRMNIHVLANQEIAYFIANAVILYNQGAHTQRHYREHTEDVKCMAVHANGNVVATGQCSGQGTSQQNTANIRVWRADTLQTLYTLGAGMFGKAVTALAFAKDSDLLAAVDQSPDKQLTVWDVADGRIVANTTINIDVVCSMGFNPADPALLVTTGKEHIGWWKVYAETHTIQKFAKPEYENYLRARFVICQTHTERGDLITGDSNGTIYIWGGGGNRITNFVKHGHECPVFTVLYFRHHVLSGGRDGTLQCWQWNKNMDTAGSIELPKSEGGVRMLQVYKESLLIGTTMNSILSLTLAQKGSPLDGADLDQLPLTQGHFDDVRGLQKITSSFIGADFVTAGVDGVICKFSSENHQPVWKIVMKETTFLCVDCSADGRLLAFGTHDGHLVILELNPDDLSVTEAFNMKLTKERLDTVKLAPDCLSVAVGGHDKAIYIFSLVEREDVGRVWEMQGKCKGHRGTVTSMDWSTERSEGDYYMRSSSSTCHQRFWNVSKLEAVLGSVCEKVQWASDRCIIDHKLTGLWGSKQGKEGMIHAVDVNPPRTVVAMGDSNGYLSLFRYPCSKTGVFSHAYRCHHAVHCTCFSPSGNYVMCVGGKDACVMQWKIV